MQRPRLPVLSLILAVIGIVLVIFATLSPLASASEVNSDALPSGPGLAQQVTPTVPRGSPGPTATATPPSTDPDKVPTPVVFAIAAASFAAGVAVGYALGRRSQGGGPIDRGPIDRGPQGRG